MRCDVFETRLEAYLDGTMDGDERRAAHTHRLACGRCAALAEALRASLDLLDDRGAPASAPEDLAEAVLVRTSGSACGRAQDLLGAFAGGDLEAPTRVLVASHVQHCGRCGALASTLAWLAQELPAFAALEPDARFAADVHRATAALHVRRTPWRAHVRAACAALVGRPRFALEAAYVGTVVLVLLFGTSMSPFRNVPTQTLAVVQIDPRQLAEESTTGARRVRDEVGTLAARGWRATGGRVAERLGDGLERFAARRPGMAAAASRFELDARALGQALRDGNFAAASLAARVAGEDVVALWRSLRAPAGEP